MLIGLLPSYLSAQILIQTNPPLDSLVKRIVGELSFDNPSYIGKDVAKALFDNGSTTNLGIERGIVLSSGQPTYIPGPNDDCGVSKYWYEPGYPLLDELVFENQTTDAAVLAFDVVPETDTLRFTYVFGSEEYNNFYVILGYSSDVFGCFISGPKPTGGSYSDENIAVLPISGEGEITIQPVNINNGDAPCGIIPPGPCVNCEFYLHNINGPTLQYNGFTVVLKASINVIPCETYHVTLGIADAGQFGYTDSGVFIEASDYISPSLDISVEPSASDTVVQVVEGCSGADLILKLPEADFAPVSAYFDYSLSTANPEAWPDGDFEEALPTEITFEEGEDSLAIHLAPVSDGITEGDELLRIIVSYTLPCDVKYDTVDILISDYFPMQVQQSADTSICTGDSVNIWVAYSLGSAPYSIEWLESGSEADTISVNPVQSTWYQYQIIDFCEDTVIDSVLVSIIPYPEADLGPDTIICNGDTITLQSFTGDFEIYFWSTGDTTASISINQPGIYTLNVTNICGTDEDDIIIDQWPYPEPNIGPDLELCYGEFAFLQADPGFISYIWQDNSTNDFYTVLVSGLYIIHVEDIHGCIGSDSVLAFVGDVVQLEDTTVLCEGSPTSIIANADFDNYYWSTGEEGVDSIVVDQEGWYGVNVSYSFGCPSEDSTFVESTPIPVAEITGDDLLCEGDTLWLTAPEGKYEYFWNDEYSDSDQLMVTSGGNYTLRMINACGEDENSKFVQLSPLPNVDLGEDLLLFPGESVTLDAGSFLSYEWNNDSNQNGRYFILGYEDINVQDSIWVMVFDGFCENKDDIIIEVFNVKIPNVITPNGDGYNDKFQPIEDLSGINNHNVMVFSRWGEKIWESSDFNSGWDGKNNGRYVADGTYYWVLEVWYGTEAMKKMYKGNITVLGTEN